MSLRTNTILISLMTLSVVLAGCTSSDAGTDSMTGDDGSSSTVQLTGNQGAISGLIVDDNYRPVQLKEDWGNSQPGDFQDVGFVLIQETGQRFETSENGEFTVLPLEAGTYTVRVAADNHEAITQTVNVVAGEFAEITLEARRTFSGGGTVLSQEEVLFMSCSLATSGVRFAAAAVGGCGDLSGDSGRFDFYTDYSAISDIIRGMVTEFRGAQEGYYGVTIRTFVPDGCECEYADFELFNEQYDRNVLYPDQAMRREGRESDGSDTYYYLQEGEDGWRQPGSDDTEGGGFWAMTFDYEFQTAMFADHSSRYYTMQVLDPIGCHPALASIPNPAVNDAIVPVLLCDAWGNGMVLGVKAQFLQTVFLYELPEEGIDDYCALCEDADIPE